MEAGLNSLHTLLSISVDRKEPSDKSAVALEIYKPNGGDEDGFSELLSFKSEGELIPEDAHIAISADEDFDGEFVSFVLSAENFPYDLLIQGTPGTRLQVKNGTLKFSVRPRVEQEYETLLQCWRSGQMSYAQLQEHMKDDPKFAEWMSTRLN